jgi:hypothetical protein
VQLLASPRRRRRLAWSFVLTLALAGVVAIAVFFWNTADWTATPVEDTPIRTEGELVAKPIKMTPTVRREVRVTLDRFVEAAVLRKRLEEGWRMSTPALRGSVTHRDWARGELPIQPYPWKGIRRLDLRFLYTDTRSVAVDVMLVPQDKANPILVYTADLTPVGNGERRRWLVDYWAPQASIGGGSPPPPPEEQQRQEREAAPKDNPTLAFDDSRLGPEWFLVPGAILLLLIGIPVGIAIRNTIAGRRAERRYREELRG